MGLEPLLDSQRRRQLFERRARDTATLKSVMQHGTKVGHLANTFYCAVDSRSRSLANCR